MRQRKFESLESAKEYLVERGELTYMGRIDMDTSFYIYIHQGQRYELFIEMNGLVKIIR